MGSGIDRVARAQLMELLKLSLPLVEVIPVYLCEKGELHYRYAHQFSRDKLGIETLLPDEIPIEVEKGDIFYSSDFYRDGTVSAFTCGIYDFWKSKGVTISFFVHDLLPVTHPEFFPRGTEIAHAKWLNAVTISSDILICNSQAVADDLAKWMKINIVKKRNVLPQIGVAHLGCDIKASLPSEEMPAKAEVLLEKFAQKPTFLMVGTIEPRKGHLQVLKAFDILWEEGFDINFLIVGSEGWKGLPDSQRRTIPEIIVSITTHPRLNEKLFWLEGVSDLFLEHIYKTSAALIMASENEGFGIPLVEAAYYKLPIIARDIPVFREIAKNTALYFSDSKAPDILADTMKSWIKNQEAKHNNLSDSLAPVSWGVHTKTIVEHIQNL